MITLPQTKRWTGDSFGDACARIFNLIQRNETVALYSRTVEESSRTEGYEVFTIKIRHKGDKLPGGMVEPEDREVYPSSGSFGKSAWHIHTLDCAKQRFEELTAKGIADETEEAEEAVEKPFLLPVGEFTTKELAAFNNVDYPIAFLWLKDNVDKVVRVKGVRQPLPGVRGKPSKTYEKLP